MVLNNRRSSSSAIVPAPVGGWDTRNALADMPIKNAVIMDNWFPDTERIILRKGTKVHVSGMNGPIESLIPYASLSGSGKLFAAVSGNLYDVTSENSLPFPDFSGFLSSRFQHIQFGNASGNYVLIFNGIDTPRIYNGTSWSLSTITGPNVNNLIWCNSHQKRIWVGEVNSMIAWYGGIESIGGPFQPFNLNPVAKLGGYIMAMGTWSRDGGEGLDDVAVFLTSEGEAIIYQGIDPNTATDWELIGVFRIGKPIGRRCLIKAGSDLLINTEDGILPCSQILTLDRTQSEKVSLSRQINKAINDSVNRYGNLFGWELFLYPKGKWLLLNIPQQNQSAVQYVFNTLTGAPCRFVDIPAWCWALLNGDPYYGGPDGAVYRADFGTTDNGKNINGDLLQAFSYFGNPGVRKAFKRCEIVFQSSNPPEFSAWLNTDFQILESNQSIINSPSSSAQWNISKWNESLWSSSSKVFNNWKSIKGFGRSAAMRVKVSTNKSSPAIISLNYIYINGGQY